MFTKPPLAGRVKTRLIGDLSATQAADLHQAMVEDVVRGVLPGKYQMIVAWALETGQEPPSSWPVAGLRCWEQTGEGLGDRLYGALRDACCEFASVAEPFPNTCSDTHSYYHECPVRQSDLDNSF